ncbi:MAG: HEPN domain-containing protein [Patescibacteria group bacterium]
MNTVQNEGQIVLVKEWFSKADSDLKFAKAGYKETGLPYQTCFLSQQTAEKYLKGYLTFYNKHFKKTHDLIELANLCQEIDEEFKKILEACLELNDYYIITRYPFEFKQNFTDAEVQKALKNAKVIRNFIFNKVNNARLG